MTILVACGGGGSGSVSTGLQSPPDRLVANTDETRTLVGGTAAPTLSSAEIGRTLRSIASGADTLLLDVAGATSVACGGAMCVYNLGEVENTISPDQYSAQTLGEEGEEGVMGYNENNEAVMTDRGVTIGQRHITGRISTDAGLVSFEYQMYGGWNDDNHFGIERIVRTGGNNSGTDVRTYSFGDASGSNPTGTGWVNWAGVMVGAHTQTGHVVQGDASIQINFHIIADAATVLFDNIKNLNTGGDITRMSWTFLSLTNGTFEDTGTDMIKGTFYGAGGEEVGGVFDRDNIIGSFGAIRQTSQ